MMGIRGFVLVAALALAGCASPPPPVAERADVLMRELVQRHRFQGAVVMGRGGTVEYAAGFGWADVERQRPFTPDTPTDGASMAKTFTAAALLMLANEGRVDLDMPVRDILPEFPHARTRVRHLLAHSAGLVDYDWLDQRVGPGQPRTNASHLALLARDAPVPHFEPGSAFTYDNVAYDVAAMVIERRAGKAYADVIAERFSLPLGLAAFVRPARFADWQGPRTRGYRRTAEGWKDHDAHDHEGFHGGANLYLSARDLQRWVAGYAEVVGAATARAALASARLDDGRATGISLGSWYVSPDGTRRYYTGSHNGFFSFGYADHARNLSIAWVANDAPPSWLQPALSRALVAIAEGRAPERLVAPPVPDAVADPSGRYRVSGVGDVIVHRDGQQLRVRHRRVDYQGFPVARGVYYVPGLDAYLRFAADPQGQATLTWDAVFLAGPPTARIGPGEDR
ncbi:serine hydrolase [Ideonella sp. A 288]|uniref:serine hydrolase domain-containing protein n=1 Tax=Ideonella sp. A 288 TaxID=1962181 RepID=UPI000B4AB1C7|nr:serine hydrolase domain-containing protein [Ideonella sp. A 288]